MQLAVSYINPTSKFGNLAASVQLLEQFGNVKVLSSPTLSVMNNQTAMLRVVDNLVYFIVTPTVTPSTVHAAPTYTTTLDTSPVGFTMSMTPQISDNDSVLLNIRPSITRLLGCNDPTRLAPLYRDWRAWRTPFRKPRPAKWSRS